ncbi:fibronectin type III domain-containing protein [Pseudomonas sp. KK4]|uniref:fibronectin type III domain-containing protein n=1 Tax=Pseudomonas sp. KK4 TaxID=1855729 RepID=UPI00097CBD0F|nr:fibronectin type III domain-containing protein [Pseudomonas sp. KK4]
MGKSLSDPGVQICSPGNLKGHRTSSTTATLTWDEPYATCGLCPDAVGYELSSSSFNTLDVAHSPYELRLSPSLHRIQVRVKGANGSVSEPGCIDIHPSPPAPVDLRACDLTDSGMTLNWTAPAGGEPVSDYVVSHKGQFTAAVRGLVYRISEPAGQRTPDVQVRARSVRGDLSDPATLDITPPGKPTGLRALNLSSRATVLVWAGAADNVKVVRYEVLKDNVVIDTTRDATPSYSATGLVPQTRYAFAVRALDAFGNRSELSQAITVQTPFLDAPRNLRVVNVTRSSIVLAWDRPDEAIGLINYKSEVDNHKGSSRSAQGPALDVTFIGLKSGSTYSVAVSANDASQRYSPPATLEVKTL